jgi:hypothetical protein
MGLIAALLVAVMAPGAALAADKGKAADPNAIPADSRKKGMAEAPKVVQAAGLACTVTDARLVGTVSANKATNTPARDFYEVACNEGVGYVLGAQKDGPVDVNSCIETYGGTVACKLPANLDPRVALGAALTKAGSPCTAENVRGIGQTASGAFIEVACQGGVGYIVQGSKPFDVNKPMKPTNCLAYDAQPGGQLKCTLAEPATRLQVVDKLVGDAKVTCGVKDRRYIGTFKDGSEGYEVSCTQGKGYVLKVSSKGVVAQECTQAPGLCELVDARAAMSEQAALYTRLAKAAGSSCDVASYALFPSQPGKEVLELTCKDGAEMVGVFPVGGKGEVYDCGRAMIAGYKCGPGKAKYDSLTADLRTLGKTECVVSDVALRAKSDKGQPQIEVACTDGKPGYLVQYENPNKPVEALGCRLTGCTLPTNRPKS